jgi:hypothetical protein
VLIYTLLGVWQLIYVVSLASISSGVSLLAIPFALILFSVAAGFLKYYKQQPDSKPIPEEEAALLGEIWNYLVSEESTVNEEIVDLHARNISRVWLLEDYVVMVALNRKDVVVTKRDSFEIQKLEPNSNYDLIKVSVRVEIAKRNNVSISPPHLERYEQWKANSAAQSSPSTAV